MKKFNIIASIIVLVLALVSAVASYFLYEKRVQFVEGWGVMSDAIAKSSSKLNSKSQIQTPGITKDALDHKKYDTAMFKTNVDKFPKQVDNFIAQHDNVMSERNMMNEAIAKVSKELKDYGFKLPEKEVVKAETEEAQEGEESNADSEGEEAQKEAVQSPEAIDTIAFENNPDAVKEQIDAFNQQAEAFFKHYAVEHAAYEKLKEDHKKLQAEKAALEKEKATLSETARRLQGDLNKITTQRNYMADRFAAIGKKVGAGKDCEKPADFSNFDTYQIRIEKVAKQTATIVDNRNNIIKEFVALAKANGETVNEKDLLNNPGKGIAPLSAVIQKQRVARQKYGQALMTISNKLGGSFRDNIAQNFIDPQQVINAVNAKYNEAKNLENALIKAGKEKQQDKITINNQAKRIAKLEADAREFAKANELEKTGGDVEIKNWPRGSVEARMATVGTVTKVSNDYGYIVINFGTETTVIQEIGKKRIPVNPDLQSGLKFNVVRDGKFVATIALRIVDKAESTADIPLSKAGEIKVGDKVVFAK